MFLRSQHPTLLLSLFEHWIMIDPGALVIVSEEHWADAIRVWRAE
jgi:hypothetical protein